MLNTQKLTLYLCLLIVFTFISCEPSSINSPTPENDSPKLLEATQANLSAALEQRGLDPGSIKDMEDLNKEFAEKGLNIRLAYAETVTKVSGSQTATGQTIIADDREKRLDAQWVPGDERRNADGNNLTYLVDQTWLPANFGTPTEIDGETPIDASFDTWNSVKKNPKLNIVKVPDTGAQPSSFFLGGNPFLADISEIGYMPGILFEIVLGSGSSESVLGVTFTAVFTDEEGNPTDINNDGYADVAYKEVWYNDAFQWTNDPNGTGVDIETVAVHENGHALGFGHFGKVFVTNGNNKLHVAPRAVMNAVILGTQRDLLGNEKSSYNSVYGSWPK